ncbi:capsid and scaffold protein [Clostridium phage CPD4]|nr:capsid and scaffold protein [Clostridium phage CPD4]
MAKVKLAKGKLQTLVIKGHRITQDHVEEVKDNLVNYLKQNYDVIVIDEPVEDEPLEDFTGEEIPSTDDSKEEPARRFTNKNKNRNR